MVHVIFDPSLTGYDDDLFLTQTGGSIPLDDPDQLTYTIYRGSPPYQRGYGTQKGSGIGDIFRGIYRFFLPLLRRVGTAVGQEALNTGQRVFDKVVVEGAPLKQTVVSEGKRGIDTVLDKGGFPKQFGTGRRKKGIKRKPSFLSHQTLIGKSISKPKRVRSDTFGLY